MPPSTAHPRPGSHSDGCCFTPNSLAWRCLLHREGLSRPQPYTYSHCLTASNLAENPTSMNSEPSTTSPNPTESPF